MKTAIFDLGNVIIYFSFSKMIQQVSLCTGLPEERIHFLLINQNLRAKHEGGEISDSELHRYFSSISPKVFSKSSFFHALSDIFRPNESIFPILKKLKENGLRLVLLSNTSKPHYDYLSNHYPILNLFDAKILSYEIGANKPHPKMYQAALAAAGCPPAECFYTDDIPEYVAAAKMQGIDSEVFTDTDQLLQHLHQRRLLAFSDSRRDSDLQS